MTAPSPSYLPIFLSLFCFLLISHQLYNRIFETIGLAMGNKAYSIFESCNMDGNGFLVKDPNVQHSPTQCSLFLYEWKTVWTWYVFRFGFLLQVVQGRVWTRVHEVEGFNNVIAYIFLLLSLLNEALNDSLSSWLGLILELSECRCLPLGTQ